VCRRKATTSASSSAERTVDRGALARRVVFQACALPPLRHRLGIDAISRTQRLDRSLRSLYCCSDGVSGRGAPVKYLSHSVFLVVASIVPPPHCGTTHLAEQQCMRRRHQAPSPMHAGGALRHTSSNHPIRRVGIPRGDREAAYLRRNPAKHEPSWR